MQPDAWNFLIDKRFPVYAWSILLSPEGLKKKLDALLMVADCQNRVGKLATLYNTVEEDLGPEKFAVLKGLATTYLEGALKDRAVTKMKTVEHVVGSNPPSPLLIDYMSNIKTLVGEADFQFVGDCFANFDNAVFYYCELGSLVQWLPKTGYRVEMPSASGEGTELVDRVYEGRIRLAQAGIEHLSKLVEAWTTDEWKNTPQEQRATRKWSEFWDQVATIWHASETHVKNNNGTETPCRDFRCAMLITFADMIQRDIPLITEHRMIEMTPSPSEGPSGSDDVPSTIQYDLCAFANILWSYSKEEDRFMPVSQVPQEQMDRPYPTIDMPNYHREGQADIGFGCTTVEEYLGKFKSGELSIEMALMPLIFDHPSVSGLAVDAGRDWEGLYRAVCPDTEGLVTHDRTSIRGFSLSTAPGLQRPSFFELFKVSGEIAQQHGLVNNQEFLKVEENSPRIRRDQPCDTGLRHVYLSSFTQSNQRCQSVFDKLHEDLEAKIGRYVVREDDRAISFMDEGFAKEYFDAKNAKKKTTIIAMKEHYCSTYPHNKAFHPEVPATQQPGGGKKKEKKQKKQKGSQN